MEGRGGHFLWHWESDGRPRWTQFTQDAKADLHADLHTNLPANPLMLLATCVNTPIDHSVFHYLLAPVARCSAPCVNRGLRYPSVPTHSLTLLSQPMGSPFFIIFFRPSWSKEKKRRSPIFYPRWIPVGT